MKLVTYAGTDEWRAGIVVEDDVLDLQHLLAGQTDHDAPPPPSSVRTFLDAYGYRLAEVSASLTRTAANSPQARVGRLPELQLGPPVPDPSKVLCIGLNYQDHVAETGRALPLHPDVFAKFATTLIGPYDDIACSSVSDQLDFEGELAVVIGRVCRAVPEEEALAHVAGLMVLNDTTARDLQYNGTQWLPGKAVDASTPCGPALVTLDEVGDPHDLGLVTRVNGTEVQSSRTRHLIFRIPRLVSYVSQFLQLAPGDVISTGTPEGIGAKRKPPLWLRPGDQVEVEVENVGLIRSTIR